MKGLKRRGARYLALMLIICMLTSTFMTAPVFASTGNDGIQITNTESSGVLTNYQKFIECLKVLEEYADAYQAAYPDDQTKNSAKLVINYIRTGVERYTDDNWETLAGPENTAFVNFVKEKDEANGTEASALRNLGRFVIPNDTTAEFDHMFGALDLAYPSNDTSKADFGSWVGDLCDLLSLTVNKNVPIRDMELMTNDIKLNYLPENFENEDNKFGILDINADLDAFFLDQALTNGERRLSTVFEGYYTEDLTDEDRAAFFLNTRFAGLTTKQELRDAVYNAYTNNAGIDVLEAKRGIHEEAERRQACCYAFADYLFDLAGDRMTGEGGNQGGEGGGESGGWEGENPYYSVFNSETSTLAPGVIQTIKNAYTSDNKQLAYYIATVDINREDVSVHANYKDNQGSEWGMQRVTDQMAAAQAKHSNPKDTANYIPNYKTIVGVNGDFYNMSTGKVAGALVMEGVEYSGVGSENFFAILKDGRAVIGAPSEWSNYKGQVQEAIGGGALLVDNGKMAVKPSSTYYTTRASRTCVGITADNKVVMMVLDGRQEPFSAGGSYEELAQIMMDAGCVKAINLDGGGSTTFAAKQEGSDEVSVVNRPSDGFQRSVSSSLLVVSTAKSSDEFDHALVSSEADYLTVGTSMRLEAVGVNNIGNAADIPEGVTWRLSNSNVASIKGNTITALATGNVTVDLMLDGKIVGSKVLHVVTPDKVEFTKDIENALYGEEVELPILATYKGNEVKINEDDVKITFDYPSAGALTGFTYVGRASSGIRTVKITVALASNESSHDMLSLNLYNENEAVFDFDNATSGERMFAWIRDVKNATEEQENSYHVVNAGDDVYIDYTFGMDMTAIPIPEVLSDIVYMLPGADVEGASAWTFLLQLAERVSVKTNVTVEIDFDDNLEVDLTNLTLVTDYFELDDIKFNKETNTVYLTCYWIDRTQAIEPSTANPICMVSGIKCKVKDSAPEEVTIRNYGSINYDIFLRASSLYSFANVPANQQKYQIYPFYHEDILINGNPEAGAHFANEYAKFNDVFSLDLRNRQGWFALENFIYYYKDNEKITGIHYLDGKDDPQNKYYYNFLEDGTCAGTVTGLFEMNGDTYYAVRGERKTGWHSFPGPNGEAQFRYFDPATGKGVDGKQKIDGYNYEFEDGILVRGQLVKDSNGTRYMWAGQWSTQEWITVDGNTYYTLQNGYCQTGMAKRYNAAGEWGWYVFDDEGVWQKDLNGLHEYNGQTYLVKNGGVVLQPGLVIVGEHYYYFRSSGDYEDSYAIKNRSYYVTKTNGLLPAGNYNFDAMGRLVFDGKQLPGASLSFTMAEYTGSAIKPVVTVPGLTQGTHYAVTYENNVNAGTATVRITGMGDYKGLIVKTFTITKNSNGWTTPLTMDDWTFGSAAKAPNAKSAFGEVTYKYFSDAACSDEIAKPTVAGSYYVKAYVAGTDNYKGLESSAVKFTISPKAIGEVELKFTEKEYTGGAIKPAVTVGELIEGEDYEVTYTNNVNVGTATVTVKGIGNYTGTVTKTFTITKGTNLWTSALTLRGWTYGKATNLPKAVSKYGDVTYKYFSDSACQNEIQAPVNAGTYYVKAYVAGTDNYTGLESNAVKFTISKLAISDATLEYTQVEYTGNAFEPKVTVDDLVLGTDYTVTYKNNKNAGTATVTIKGIGNCSGSVSKNFTILKGENKWTTELKLDNWLFGEAENSPVAEAKFGTVTYKYFSDAACQNEISKPSAPGTYYVKAYAAGTSNYTALESEAVAFAIVQDALPTPNVDTASKEYTGSAITPAVTIPGLVEGEDFEVRYENNVNVGEATIKVIGKGSYGGSYTKTFVITKATNSWTAGLAIDGWTYGQTAKEPSATATFGTATYKYFADEACTREIPVPQAAGTYYVKAYVAESNNYKGLESDAVAFVVAPKNLVSAQLGYTSATYDGNAHTPVVKINGLEEGRDFTVTYKDNTNAGTATVTIVGKGNYAGTITKTFTIVKATNAWTSGLTMEGWKAGETAKNPSAAAKFGTVTYKYFSDEACKNEITKPAAAGTYYVKAYVAGTANYNALESAAVKFVIKTAEPTADRYFGSNRYATAFKSANELKEKLGVNKFDTIIVASGSTYADALPGSYLAAVKNAPILLLDHNSKSVCDEVKAYIDANLAPGGTVYLLGGEGVISKNFALSLAAYNVDRLGGSNRYDTNLQILKEAGVGNKDILVCAGLGYADSLSASATGLPILLVGNDLTAEQKEFLGSIGSRNYYVIGGEGAVNKTVEKSLKAYGTTERVAGKNRYETSTAIAAHKKLFPGQIDTVVLAYGLNYPDGLTGGPLAMAYGAPLLLVTSNDITAAANFAKSVGASNAVILGGPALISDTAVNKILGK